MTHKYLLVVIFFFICIANCYADSIGRYWKCETPEKNIIKNESGSDKFGSSQDKINLYLKNGVIVENIKKWYFYKQNIIGTFDGDAAFIANELNYELIKFKTINDWEEYRIHNNLMPVNKIKWFSNEYSGDTMTITIFTIGWLLILIPCSLFIYLFIKIIKVNIKPIYLILPPYIILFGFTLFKIITELNITSY